MLFNPPPLPPPMPPIAPPPDPPSPPPVPPPSPPYSMPQRELLEYVREIEERACASVYWQTTQARCESLAVSLTERHLWTALSPPLPPPASPLTESPLPPSPPPSPLSPSEITEGPILHAILSTIRLPAEYDASPDRDIRENTPKLANDGYVMLEGLTFDDSGHAALPVEERAECFKMTPPPLRSRVLPCVSGVRAETCLDGARHCGDAEQNGRDPYLEIKLVGHPHDRLNYLFGVQVVLPQTLEFANLMFRSGDDRSNDQGFRFDLYKGDGTPIELDHTPATTVGGAPDDREFVHLFAPGDPTDHSIQELSDVVFVRLTLPGRLRQIWIKQIKILERPMSLVDVSPRPPMTPPLPSPPPSPPPDAITACTFSLKTFFEHPERAKISREEHPCGLTRVECARKLTGYTKPAGGTLAYTRSDAGCCIVYVFDHVASVVSDANRINYQGADAGTCVA